MKKVIALTLCLIMMFSCAVPAFASSAVEHIPIITLRGDGTQIYVPDETAENGERNIWGDAFTSIEGGDIKESVVTVLEPFLMEGLLQDKWDNYYQAFYDEIAPIFEELRMDGNGDPQYNSGLGKDDLKNNATSCLYNNASWQGGKYDASDYTFRYDWRLDPAVVAEELHQYILQVMKSTGKKKVALAGNCLGGSFILAYLQKYGTQGHIKNVFFNATVGNGSVVLTDAFCGDINLDFKALQRFTYQNVDPDSDTFAGLFDTMPILNEVILSSYDLLSQTGVLDRLGLTFDQLYQKIYEGLVPRLAIAIFATMPGYWTVVETEKYEEAKAFVFGKEGDERYEEYKGLITKLDNYYNNVSSKKAEIIEACRAAGVHFGASAKYGVQMYPFVKSQNQLSDEMVDLENASFGATVAPDVFSTLPDSHIQKAISAGNGKYISPDKQIDASTSLFKDSLWIMKNVVHNNWTKDDKLIEEFSRHTEFNVNDDPDFPQFMILLPDTIQKDPETGKNDNDTGTIVPMTEENCHLTLWDEMPEDAKEKPTVISRLMSFFRWLTAMFKYILHLSSEKPVLGEV